MKKIHLAAALGVVVVLLGCNSFNNWQFTAPAPSPAGIPSAMQNLPVDKPEAAASKDSAGCPLYIMPELPAIPPLPLEQLAKAPAKPHTLDAIQQQHIEDLRNTMLAARRMLHDTYNAYLEGCHLDRAKK